ncbi:hypothetical protein SLEP1_g19188 [Rubroshorea leprosula]|nr:hypothetical protein SLEP1_g19188 [Rubroshorea leprosula]
MILDRFVKLIFHLVYVFVRLAEDVSIFSFHFGGLKFKIQDMGQD